MTDEEHRNAFKTASGTMDGKTFIFLDGEKNLLCGMDLDCNRYSPVSDEIEDSLLIDPYSDTYYVESKILGSLPVNASKYNAIELCENGQKGVLFNRGGGNGSGLLVFDIIPR